MGKTLFLRYQERRIPMLDQIVVTPLVSKYAAKKAARLEEQPAEVEVLVGEKVTPEAKNVELDLFATLVEDLLGDDKDDLDRMTALRSDAYALIQKAKAFDLGAIETKCKREAYDWEAQMPKDAERQMWNELTEKFRTEPAKLEIVRKYFLDLQTAAHTRDGDPAKKEKFQNMVLAVVNDVPRMKKLHEENLERALSCLQHLEDQKTLQEKYWTEAKDKFEEANIIATLHGWPITEAKNKDNKK
jgi:hypothetical protein